jgi:hypothetical protein
MITGDCPVVRHSSDKEEFRERLALKSHESRIVGRKFFRGTGQCFSVSPSSSALASGNSSWVKVGKVVHVSVCTTCLSLRIQN